MFKKAFCKHLNSLNVLFFILLRNFLSCIQLYIYTVYILMYPNQHFLRFSEQLYMTRVYRYTTVLSTMHVHVN